MVETGSHLKLIPTSILNIYKVFEHNGSLSHTHPTWLRFWGSGSLVESKWLDYVMVETDSHLKLLPTSILDMYKAFGHVDMLSNAYGSSLTHVYLPYLAQTLGLWVTCGVKMMSLCHG